MPARSAARKKVVVDMPSELYKEAQAVIHEQHTTQSKLVREALTYYLADLKRKKLEQALREGYLANAALDINICQEFESADAEIVD